VVVLGDAHVYRDHFDGLREQLARPPRPSPTLRFGRSPDETLRGLLATSKEEGLRLSDFVLEGYDPHPAIRLPMAV
jgi:thymidylate synthase